MHPHPQDDLHVQKKKRYLPQKKNRALIKMLHYPNNDYYECLVSHLCNGYITIRVVLTSESLLERYEHYGEV